METTSNRFGTKLSELSDCLSPEVKKLLRVNPVLIPLIIALGPRLANKVRREHLEFILKNKDLIPVLIKAGGTSAWVMLEGFHKLQGPYIGSILD